MKIRVKIETRCVRGDLHFVTGLMVDHNKVIDIGPFLDWRAKIGERWPVVRNRLLSKGLIITEQLEDFKAFKEKQLT